MQELVEVCKSSIKTYEVITRRLQMSAKNGALASAAKEMEHEAVCQESKQQNASSPELQKAKDRLEKCKADRNRAAETVLQKREALRKAQSEVELAEGNEKIAQCHVQQALGDVEKCLCAESASGQSREIATLFRRIADQLQEQTIMEQKNNTEIWDKMRSISLKLDDSQREESLEDACDAVLSYLAEVLATRSRARRRSVANADELAGPGICGGASTPNGRQTKK